MKKEYDFSKGVRGKFYRPDGELNIIMPKGKQVVPIVGVEGLEPEQLALGRSARFWKLMEARRKQKGISRAKLEEKFKGDREKPREGR